MIVDVLADETPSYMSAYVPLMRALVGCSSSSVVSGAFVAAELGRYDVAAEALAITHGMPQRTLSAFGVRWHLRRCLRAELGEAGWQAAVESGRDRTPEATIDWLIEQLAE